MYLRTTCRVLLRIIWSKNLNKSRGNICDHKYQVLRFINSVTNLLTQNLVLSEHCKVFMWITYVTVFTNRSTKYYQPYISRRSLALDLKLIFQTIKAIFTD